MLAFRCDKDGMITDEKGNNLFDSKGFYISAKTDNLYDRIKEASGDDDLTFNRTINERMSPCIRDELCADFDRSIERQRDKKNRMLLEKNRMARRNRIDRRIRRSIFQKIIHAKDKYYDYYESHIDSIGDVVDSYYRQLNPALQNNITADLERYIHDHKWYRNVGRYFRYMFGSNGNNRHPYYSLKNRMLRRIGMGKRSYYTHNNDLKSAKEIINERYEN